MFFQGEKIETKVEKLPLNRTHKIKECKDTKQMNKEPKVNTYLCSTHILGVISSKIKTR